jgi:hypothetical protein
MLDLNRLAPEVTALNTAKPRVALLYSQPSIFWEGQYQGTIGSLYRVLNFMGENVTFVSERQLTEGKTPNVKWLLVPNATHVLPSTPAAVAAFAKSGGGVLLVGKESLGRDEYDRPLNRTMDYPTMELAENEPATADTLRQRLAPLKLNDLRDTANGKPSWGVEFRIVPFSKVKLVPLINLNADAKTVQLPGWAQKEGLDLLSGETVRLNTISVKPMVPRLLQISR